MKSVSLLAIALLFTACGPVEDDADAGFAPDPADAQDFAEPLDEGGDPAGAWQASMPDVPEGTVAVFDLSCGLLDGTSRKAWMLHGGKWTETWQSDIVQVGPYPQVQPCFQDSEKMMEWGADGEIYIVAGNLDHFNTPTESEGRWMGQVSPRFDPPGACAQGMEQLGLSWPVTMSLELVELRLPDAA